MVVGQIKWINWFGIFEYSGPIWMWLQYCVTTLFQVTVLRYNIISKRFPYLVHWCRVKKKGGI